MIANLIDGVFCSTAAAFVDVEPATEEPLAEVASSTPTEVDRAVVAARRAFDEGPWPRMAAAERAYYLCCIADVLESRMDAVAATEAQDTGIPLYFTSLGHIPRAVSHLRYFAGEAERMVGEALPMDAAYLTFVTRDPVGVAAILSPWNSPLSIATINIAAALAVGCTCVLKPSEQAPLSIDFLAQAVVEAELPPGVINIVHGDSRTGAALVQHAEVDAIAFTGGSDTGRMVAASLSQKIRKLGLELGGKSASIVFGDANVQAAVDGIVLSIFAGNGEACMAGSRALVHHTIFDEVLEALIERAAALKIGNPLTPGIEMGPLISREHRERAREFILNAGLAGATVYRSAIPSGLERGWYFEPTIVTGVTNASLLAQNEVFAPVLLVMPFDQDEEAVRLANDTRYGLAAYVWTESTERAMRTSRQLRCGTVTINSPMIRDIRAPFGGYKQSGLGRVGGRYSTDLFTQVKATCLPVNPYLLPKLGASA